MRWASALSDHPSLSKAVGECCTKLRETLGEAPLQLAVAFVSPDYGPALEKLPAFIKRRLGCQTFLGTTAEGVLAGSVEVENRPALSLMAASLPGVNVRSFFVNSRGLPDLDASPHAWESLVECPREEAQSFILLADPFSFPIDDMILGLDYAFPRSVTIGGMASGGQAPGEHSLFFNQHVFHQGLVGLSLSGPVQLMTAVSQGCRPIGPVYQVTNCRQNVVMGLDGRSPLEVLQEVAQELSEQDQTLLHRSLFIGLPMETPSTGEGSWLIRSLLGVDGREGHLAVGAWPRQGQHLRFHLRETAETLADVKHTLATLKPVTGLSEGAFVFSCLGRGRSFYGEPSRESRLFQEVMGDVPRAGFFSTGEIGPGAGATRLHGYSTCYGLLKPTL